MAQQPEIKKWSSNLMFLAAAIGSAVGIANIWKFTYVAGVNGGGAFVIIYILAGALVVLPALISEFLIGRRGGGSVVGTMRALSAREGINPRWRFYGFMAILGIFLALSFYAVVAGWTIDYFMMSVSGQFTDLNNEKSSAIFDRLLADPSRIMLYQAIFIGLTAFTVSFGIHRGLERVLKWMTPGLFIILIALLVYVILKADFAAGFNFLFNPDFASLTPTTFITAIGQAFFSIGVGVGVLMTIGAYMNKSSSIIRGAIIITIADMTAAILAGLIIFPIVFSNGLSPAEGPGLVFVTLPIAFSAMPGGQILGSIFFLLMAIAAFTSAVTILETIVAWLEEVSNKSRRVLVTLAGLAIWIIGLLTVFSFNIWADVRPMAFWAPMAEKNIFELLDYLVSNIIMPFGGFLVAVLAGWILSRKSVADELNIGDGVTFKIWFYTNRYIVPVGIAAMFIANLK